MALVKICGLNDEAGIDVAVHAGADWVGFNFFPRSPRFVSGPLAAALARRVHGHTRIVGLFVEPTDAAISNALQGARLDVLQVYASETRALEIRRRFGVPVWRSIPVASEADLPCETGLDGLVIEPRAPSGATRPGGNGVALHWPLLRYWASPVPWLLAGGLDIRNVAEAIRASGAEAVDVASGVEVEPGQKSPELIGTFIRRARAPGSRPDGAESVSAAPA